MKVEFFKYQGTGNDFVIIDNRSRALDLSAESIAKLCDRRFGIGADGLMLLELSPGADFRMVYYNSDGKPSSMCGNGARCIVAFAARIGIIENTARFVAPDGMHDAVINNDGTVSLKMKDVKEIEKGEGFFFVDTGSPHYVTVVDDPASVNVVQEGRTIRNSDRFAAEGTNVNFIAMKDDVLHVRTYERGVEDETYSCGTGVTASALVAAFAGLGTRPGMKVSTPGGILEVSFEKVLDQNFYNIWLKGPAIAVFDGITEVIEAHVPQGK